MSLSNFNPVPFQCQNLKPSKAQKIHMDFGHFQWWSSPSLLFVYSTPLRPTANLVVFVADWIYIKVLGSSLHASCRIPAQSRSWKTWSSLQSVSTGALCEEWAMFLMLFVNPKELGWQNLRNHQNSKNMQMQKHAKTSIIIVIIPNCQYGYRGYVALSPPTSTLILVTMFFNETPVHNRITMIVNITMINIIVTVDAVAFFCQSHCITSPWRWCSQVRRRDWSGKLWEAVASANSRLYRIRWACSGCFSCGQSSRIYFVIWMTWKHLMNTM